jgi:hypothetical protein
MVEEAGGTVATYDGLSPFPLTPGQDYGPPVYPLLAAATGEMVEKGRGMIRPRH